MKNKNKKSLNSFTKYCVAHPEQRFFQALTNWFGVGYIGSSGDREQWFDMWNLEEDKDYIIK